MVGVGVIVRCVGIARYSSCCCGCGLCRLRCNYQIARPFV
jgi:hypothetical protein